MTPGRSVAEEARTLVVGGAVASLSTLTAEGDPWGSFVTYGLLGDGAPVLCVSTFAEHGRNLAADPRAALVVAEDPQPADPPTAGPASPPDADGPSAGADPLAAGRVTLAGRALPPDDPEAARAAFLQAVPSGTSYVDFEDFALLVLHVERVRWVGGYARMGSCDGAEYAAAAPDPVGPSAASASRHMNEDHPDALLAMARGLAGVADATAATCERCDRYGMDLAVTTPRGVESARVAFAQPCAAPGDLRAAAVDATRRARDALR